MPSPSPTRAAPEHPSLAVGETLNSGIRVSAWFSIVSGGLLCLGGLVAVVLLDLSDLSSSGPSDAMAIPFTLNIIVGILVSSLGALNLHRFPPMQIQDTGIKIRDQLVPFAAITEVVKKERTFACVRYVEHGVTNEATIGVSWMFGGDLAPVVQWLASRAEAGRAHTPVSNATP